jgi:hypothetical protein
MKKSRQKVMTALLSATLGSLAMLIVVPPHALGQARPAYPESYRPAYPELFQDPMRTDLITPADLPNLGRLVTLEATSMFVHARSELYNSPDSYRLLDDIVALWNAADAFTAAVFYDPVDSQSIQAGRLTFPQLDTAYYQVRRTLGILPGRAPRTAVDFVNLSRVMAVIGPLLQQSPPGPLVVEDPREFDQAAISNQARELASTFAPLKTYVESETGRGIKLETLVREIDLLAELIQGFERITSGAASDREIIESFRPILSRARRINRDLARVNLGAPGLSLWRAVQQQISDLEMRFQIPREIVPGRTRELAGGADTGVVDSLDRAIRDLDGLGDKIASINPQLPQRDQVQAAPRNLTTRLLLVRQYLLGQAPRERLNQALADLELSWRQLQDRLANPALRNLEILPTLKRDIDEMIARTREQTSKPR